MGYALAYGTCFGCQKTFSFNPHRVPSIPIDGDRQPICRECVELVNPKRIENGLAPIVLDPEAYEPVNENEL